MIKNSYNNTLFIRYSFFIVITLQLLISSFNLYFFFPCLIKLLLIYWIIFLPYCISFNTIFFFGLIIDCILGSSFGIYELELSIFFHFLIFKFQLFKNFSFIRQIITIIFLSFFTKIIIFLIEHIFKNVNFGSEIFVSSLLDGLFWPIFFILMKKIQIKIK